MSSSNLINPSKSPAAEFQFIVFPHAGGSASFYYSWAKTLGPMFDVLLVDLPGRGKAFDQDLLRSPPELKTFYDQTLFPVINRPFIMFGHSLGSYIAMHAASELPEALRRNLHSLVLSSQDAPTTEVTQQRQPRLKILSKVSDEFLIQWLKNLGALPAELLANPEALAFALPILRADIELLASFNSSDFKKISAPILTLSGRKESRTPKDQEKWSQFTDSRLETEIFSGDHFYFLGQEKAVIEAIKGFLNQANYALASGSVA